MSVQSGPVPTSWAALLLGDVIDYGQTLKAEPEELSADTWVLELEDVEKDTSRVIQRLTFADRQSKSTKNRFRAGDVLYGKLRPYLNKVVYADRAGVCTTEIVPIQPNEAVDGRYLFHWLRHPAFLSYVTEVSHGVNMPRLGTDAGRAAPLVLAPKAEQRRIADKLDTVLTRVDAVNDRLARVAPLLKRFRQSVLAAAMSGKLTEEWRAKRMLPTEWTSTNLGEMSFVTKLAGFEYTKHVRYIDGGDLKVIKAENVGRDGFKTTEFSTVASDAVAALTRSKIKTGDLLIVFVGAGTGQVGSVPVGDNWFLGPNIALIRVDPDVALGEFVEIFLRSPLGQAEVARFVKSTAQPSLSMTSIRLFKVPILPIEEQAEIVRRVELIFGYTGRLEARLKAAQTAADRLTPALLAKAFRGELVPQDPNDEPASELLKRLAAQTPAAPAKPRGRPRSRAA